MNKEIEFIKYKKRGDYHWQGLKKNIFSFNAFQQARYQIILNQLPKLNKDKKLIDIGCGDGALDYLIKIKKGGQIFGIDPSKEAILIAENKFKKLKIKKYKFKIGEGGNLSFTDNSFDHVICADVIEHIKNPQKTLKEIKRVLKSGGKVIVSSVIKLSKEPEDKMHIKEYTVKELKRMMDEYFNKGIILQTHCSFLKKIYQFSFKVGKYQPQPFRYLFNFLAIVFSLNIFNLNLGRYFTCQTAVYQK